MNKILQQRIKLSETKPVFKTRTLSDYKAFEEAVNKRPEFIAPAKPNTPIAPQPKPRKIAGWIVAGSILAIGIVTVYVIKKSEFS